MLDNTETHSLCRKNLSVFITGASSGIGYATAHFLQEQGFEVFATVRNIEDKLRLENAGLKHVLLLNIDEDDSIRDAVSQMNSLRQYPLLGLFNNAGFVQAGAIEDLSRKSLMAQFNTNVFGQIAMIQAVLPQMLEQGFGRIINNSSMLGTLAMPYRGAYNASKFALEGFNETLRLELYRTPIKVICIQPGPIATHLRDNALTIFNKNIPTEKSRHQQIYQQMQCYFSRQDACAKMNLAPLAVAKQVLHALEAKRPKAIYRTGLIAKIMVASHQWLPTALSDWIAIVASRYEQG